MRNSSNVLMVDLLIAHPIFQLIFRVSGVSTVALAFWARGFVKTRPKARLARQ
jgi:hypothetical protein